MIQKYLNLRHVLAIFLSCSSLMQAGLTTLKHFDPSPRYSANDSMMPPNSQFLDLRQAQIKHEVPSKPRIFGLNFSGFVQKAVRARGYTGTNEYGSVLGTPPNAFELGDFRGTLYPMGLFLGVNPSTGRSIWADNTTSTSTTADGTDNGSPANITYASISAFGLPSCLSNIAYQLAGYPSTPTNPNVPSSTGLVFIDNPVSATSTTPPTSVGTSIFSDRKLSQDSVYFGAFSLPIEYQQSGLRWELNINCSDYIGLTVQSGCSRMKQYYINNLTTPTTPGQTAIGPYSLSSLATTGTTTPTSLSNLYNELNQSNITTVNPPGPGNLPGGNPVSTGPAVAAQATFNKYISNNIATILNPDCEGSDPLCSFEDYSVNDINIILSFKNVYEPFRYRHADDDDTGSWPDMIFTPYGWIGGTFPVSKETDYDNILSLPFGNNGHASVGGALGMTFDFAESIEVGFEGGATHFFAHQERRPFPTHRLQRLLYPFKADVVTQPGMNWHFRALLNAYQFLKHCNFWMTYELIEHRKDCFTILTPAQTAGCCNPGSSSESTSTYVNYFVPEVLSCRSDWRAQFFNAGLSFDIQPGLQASLVWQQPISPRNAYYPVTILGSINFLF